VDAASFASTAEAEAHELLTPAPAMRGRDIPGLSLSLMGTNWLFTATPGAISPVFENDDCYFVLLAERIDPAGVRPARRGPQPDHAGPAEAAQHGRRQAAPGAGDRRRQRRCQR
jgi:hypothetical protein